MQVAHTTCCIEIPSVWLTAVLAEDDRLVMVDLEQQFWPYLWWPGWGPLALWAHVILTLADSDTGSG